MPQQTHAAKVSQPGTDAAQRTEVDDVVDQAVADAQTRSDDIIEHTDELLDEIDAILTEEEEFAIRYVQKGGQ